MERVGSRLVPLLLVLSSRFKPMKRLLSTTGIATLIFVGLLGASCSKESDQHNELTGQAVKPATVAAMRLVPASVAVFASLPVDCEAYLGRIEECSKQPDLSADTAARLRQVIIVARRQWGGVGDRTTLQAMCRQSFVDFSQSAREVGCR